MENVEKAAKLSLSRIDYSAELKGLSDQEKKVFVQRLEQNFAGLFTLYHQIYGAQYDFFYHLQQLVLVLASGYKSRSAALKKLDLERQKNPHWYLSEDMLGMACYVDLFAGDLKKLRQRIPYLKQLGITYLHLMPLYSSPEGDSDGGYAVSDYRKVDPKLGSTKDLKALAQELDKAGISLVLDFVFNHTSDEHEWAKLAKSGDEKYQQFYYMFNERHKVDAYEQHLREIFPQVRRGNFSCNEETQTWVWTTFNSFQWDLNYSNPEVFNAITDEMLYLANLGCGGLRLDALAFIWKELGTNCENQPKAHALIQAFNACLKISAPAVVFKSEAIVHPDEVNKYIAPEECQLSYNPLLMALLWNSLATRKTRLLTASMQKSFSIDPHCAWVNYVRCHDDIGWTFDDAVAGQLGINGHDHRYFLNQFYVDRFEGSFAKGVAFQENPSNGDCRVCGSLASLAGLEKALESGDEHAIQTAIDRILLLHSVILSIGGIPLLFSGDELGLLNDYSYEQDNSKAHDARWVNRIALTDQDIEAAQDSSTVSHRILQGISQMVQIRKSLPVFGVARTEILESGNQHVFVYKRINEHGDELLALVNFSEYAQSVNSQYLYQGEGKTYRDLLADNAEQKVNCWLNLEPYQVMWLKLE
ncbi:alpha-amylase family protein [Planctobacterium marinum]|uniref:alpha-amylase family protein n=1 Tax=Planctobacterium marinum TaxID=1631968 RepID=UPI0030C745B5